MEWRQAVGVVAGCCWIYVVHVATKVKPNDIQVNGVPPNRLSCMNACKNTIMCNSSPARTWRIWPGLWNK